MKPSRVGIAGDGESGFSHGKREKSKRGRPTDASSQDEAADDQRQGFVDVEADHLDAL